MAIIGPGAGFDDSGGGGGGGGGYAPPPVAGQGWTVDPVANTITFAVAPGTGAALVVTEFAAGTLAGTSRFAIGSWNAAYGYPSEGEFYSDRLWLANTPTDPQMVWGSQIGDYTNHGRSTPLIDSDSVSFAINSRQVNAVRDLVALDKMVVLAQGGEFLMSGGQDDVITPSTLNIKPQSYRGSANVQAKVVGDTAIMVQEQGSRVYDIGYRFESDSYRPIDISVWAAHLMERYAITKIEWSQAPWSNLWFRREDGIALACTYMPEQEVIGWTRSDTGRSLDDETIGDDTIEDIVVLPGSNQSEVFFLVRRVVDGVEQRYIEQLAPEFVSDRRDWKYSDSCITYDCRNATATTMTVSGVTWDSDEDLVVTASSAMFVGSSDVDDMIEVIVGEDSVRLRIVEYVSATSIKAVSIGSVPASIREQPSAEWTLMRDTISGLDHLEGRTVCILADASVQPSRVVSGGSISLDSPGGVVTIGLPYRAHIETLEVNIGGAPTVRDEKKLLHGLALLVQETRGIKTCGGTLREEYTYPLAEREFEDYGDPTLPMTGVVEAPVSAEWGENVGHIHIISDDPLPMTILSLIPRFLTSGRTA